MEKLNINQWAEEDRPREKMEGQGAESLTNAELLAILIGSGSTKESAVELMKRLLSDCKNNLNTLGKMTIHELCQYNGIGKAKAISILAACELGKRRQMENPEERPDLGTATRIYNHMHPIMQDLDISTWRSSGYCFSISTTASSRKSRFHMEASQRQLSIFVLSFARPSWPIAPFSPPATTIPPETFLQAVRMKN